jgi:hypothetical protein
MIVPSNAMYVTRNEFNTALALVGFAQKNMGIKSKKTSKFIYSLIN